MKTTDHAPLAELDATIAQMHARLAKAKQSAAELRQRQSSRTPESDQESPLARAKRLLTGGALRQPASVEQAAKLGELRDEIETLTAGINEANARRPRLLRAATRAAYRKSGPRHLAAGERLLAALEGLAAAAQEVMAVELEMARESGIDFEHVGSLQFPRLNVEDLQRSAGDVRERLASLKVVGKDG